jgi:hypothetical protein
MIEDIIKRFDEEFPWERDIWEGNFDKLSIKEKIEKFIRQEIENLLLAQRKEIIRELQNQCNCYHEMDCVLHEPSNYNPKED